MSTKGLSTVFQTIRDKHHLPVYIQKICEHIVAEGNTLTRNLCEEILTEHSIPETTSKIQLLNLILNYIEICLEDNQLTQEEKKNIALLKRWLGIQEGEFYFYKKNEIGDIISYQIRKMYRDNIVSNEEAIFKVDLQQIFDLSFDELNEFVKEEAAKSLKFGGKIEDLDCVFTPKEYFNIKSQV